MDLDTFRENVSEYWFNSSSAFQQHVMYGALDFAEMEESLALRGMLVCMNFELVKTWRCSTCRSACIVQQG